MNGKSASERGIDQAAVFALTDETSPWWIQMDRTWVGARRNEDLSKIFFNFVTALQILQNRVSKCTPVLAEVACGRREWPSGYRDEPVELRM
jgi:hypothetical protein